MKIATAESEKEDAKRQLSNMKEERDQLSSELTALRLQLADSTHSRDSPGIHQDTRREVLIETERKLAALAEHCTVRNSNLLLLRKH